jgi:hypothetical protein
VVDFSIHSYPNLCSYWDFVTNIGENKVTVSKLIEMLQKIPQDYMVVIRGYEGGVDEVTDLENARVILDVNKEWNYGSHELLDPRDQGAGEDITEVVYLSNGVGK